MDKKKIRNELVTLLKKNKNNALSLWSGKIFDVPGHRKMKDIVPRKAHLIGMSKYLSALICDIGHPTKRTCNAVLEELIFKDYLSASTAEDTIHGQVIIKGILIDMLMHHCSNDIGKLKRTVPVLVEAIDRQILCISHSYKRRDFARLETIMRYGKKLIAFHEIDKVCHLVMEAAISESESDRGSIMLLEKDGYLRIKSSVGIPKKILAKIKRQKIGHGIAGKVAKSGQPIIINEGQSMPAAAKKALRGLGLMSAVSIPILSDHKILGVLNLGKRRFKPFFDKEDAELLLILAYEAGAAISNCYLFEEVHELYTGSIISLAAAIDARDHYTHGHSNNVANIATATARKLKLDKENVNNIYFASMLHDIGKIGIPDKVLLKRGKLTEKEFNVIKRHPIYGVKILKHIPRLSPIVPIIYHEHERYDGKGYVEGLRGKKIPVESRIIAVADAYEAMTSNRPYRKAMSKRKAIEEIKKNSGTQFDPKVVKAFLEVRK